MNKNVEDTTTSIRVYRRSERDMPSGHIPLRAADARRSVRNILEWNSYLPSDCVRSMVRMGWDYTT